MKFEIDEYDINQFRYQLLFSSLSLFFFHLYLSVKSIRHKRRIYLISRSGEKIKLQEFHRQHTVCLREEMSSRYAWVSYVSKLWRPSVELDLKMTSGISWFLLRLFPVSTNCNNIWSSKYLGHLTTTTKTWINIERKK